jgi:hypothetical protein
VKVVSRSSSIWLWLSIAAALVAVFGSIVALSSARIYAALTAFFLPQALAQDIGNLALASPAMLITAALALRGSLRAYLVWLGVLAFTVYNYVIYTFSVPFGPLFPVWVVVLGLCLYALIGGIATIDHTSVASRFSSRRANTTVAWFLVIIAALFALLWLSEDVPSIIAGSTPQSLVDMGLPTNPVHILDLAFFLPAAMITGVLLLKREPLAFTLAPALMVFLLLTGVPILLTPLVQWARAQPASTAVLVPIGTITLAVLGLLIWMLSTVRREA